MEEENFDLFDPLSGEDVETHPDSVINLAHKFLDLDEQINENEKKIKELETENKKLHEDAQKLGKVLMELWVSHDIPSMKMRGRTLYIHKQSWCKAKDKNLERAIEILREIGMDWLVETKVNTHTISSHVRECDREGVELPSKFYEAFEVNEVFSLRSRKS